MNRRLAAWVIVALGLLLVAAGAAEIAVSRTAERVADLVRPEMTDAGLAQHRADFETARDTIRGLTDEVLPAVAAEAALPQDLLQLQIALRWPDVARVIEAQDETIPFAEGALVNLERQQARFERADSLPASWLPGFAGGAGMVIVGLIVAACGLALALRPERWAPLAVAVAGLMAVLMIVVPLALQVPGKAADAQEVLDSLNPSQAIVTRTESTLEETRAGMAQFDEELLPDAAALLGVSREELDAMLAEDFPGVSAGLDEMPAVFERYEARVAIRSDGADELRTLKDIPIGWLGWSGPGFGLVLAAAAAWAWTSRRLPRTDANLEVPA